MIDKKKISQWLYDLKRLPNEKRGFASGLSSAACLSIVFISNLIMGACGIKIDTMKLIIAYGLAECVATWIFFTWAKAATKLKQENETS